MTEENIHNTFFPVTLAIESFTEKNGAPPKALDVLVPSFLDRLPTTPLVDKIEYKVLDGTNWILNAHSTALRPARVYSWRSNWNFTEQERGNLLKQFHNTAVFKE